MNKITQHYNPQHAFGSTTTHSNQSCQLSFFDGKKSGAKGWLSKVVKQSFHGDHVIPSGAS
jgi:hypothetical protein